MPIIKLQKPTLCTLINGEHIGNGFENAKASLLRVNVHCDLYVLTNFIVYAGAYSDWNLIQLFSNTTCLCGLVYFS